MINVFNLRNPIRGQKGFTLVEVIVVAIIVAALAAVAIPLYTSYVSSSRKNAVSNAVGSIASFCGACRNSGGKITPPGTTKNSDGTSTTTTSFTCDAGSGSSIQVPPDVVISTFTDAATDGKTPGTIVGAHKDDPNATATFNF